MSDPPAPSDERVRFPYVAAVFCAACVGAAVWLWMSYSYCWDLTPGELARANLAGWARSFSPSRGTYVRIRGMLAGDRSAHVTNFLVRSPPRPGGDLGPKAAECEDMTVAGRRCCAAAVILSIGACQTRPPLVGNPTDFVGRVVSYGVGSTKLGDTLSVGLNTDASRLTGESIAGLVVGGWGVFIFAVALRHWLKGRRAAAVTP